MEKFVEYLFGYCSRLEKLNSFVMLLVSFIEFLAFELKNMTERGKLIEPSDFLFEGLMVLRITLLLYTIACIISVSDEDKCRGKALCRPNHITGRILHEEKEEK